MTAAARTNIPFSDNPRFRKTLLSPLALAFSSGVVLRRTPNVKLSAHGNWWDQAGTAAVSSDGGVGACLRRSLPMSLVSPGTGTAIRHGQRDTLLTGSLATRKSCQPQIHLVCLLQFSPSEP